MHIFGPVPSRRLGRSIGINNIPPKICSFSCVYCQIGRSLQMTDRRSFYFKPEMLIREVRAKLKTLEENGGETVDYLTVVPDGEPTLDAELDGLLCGLKIFGIPVAIITNGAHLHDAKVRKALQCADWVSVKTDAVDPEIRRRVDRPHGRIPLAEALEGFRIFSGEFSGKLVTETMLVQNINDGEKSVRRTAEFLSEIKPDTAYLAIPTRPPAEPDVRPADEDAVNRAFQIYSDCGLHAEYLIGYEGNAFAVTGDPETDLLSITAVHPMREDAVRDYLQRAGAEFDAVENLLQRKLLRVSEYRGNRFYLRAFKQPAK